MRLEALGIDPSTVQTEMQAQAIIAQAEAAQKQQQGNTGQQQGGNSSQQQLISQARELAQKAGAAVSEQDSLEDMLGKISESLNVMAKDPSRASKAQEYQNELESLAQKADVIINVQQNIFNTMDMVSLSNKLILGL